MTMLTALIMAAFVATPWLIAGRPKGAAVIGLLTFLVGGSVVYLEIPSIAGPLFGGVGKITMVFFVLSAIVWFVKSNDDEKKPIPLFTGICVALVYGFVWVSSFAIFRAKDYAALVPPIEAREWKKDFQPKDPRHFRVSSQENAHFLAGRAIGQASTLDANGQPNAIGSQFTVYEEASSVQIINHQLWTIVPLDWKGVGPQFSDTIGVPGYIKISGENPTLPAEYVSLPKGKEFKYTPQAIFGKNLDRLVWRNHPDKYIADKHLEIDEEGNPHYIISMAEPTIGWSGEKVIGALIVDPVTGAGVEKLLSLEQIPQWVDRVEAEHIVHRNIDYHGKYAKGFMNRSIYGSSVLAATQTHFGYGSDGEPVFATGITAHNNGNTSDSLVAVYYTNTRTGQTVEYALSGGTTESRAVEQCNLLGDVRNKGYHGTTPQLYNIYGHLSYVVPLQNQSNAFAGVAIVDVMNPQVIAWGQNAHEAELAFKQVIVSNSSQMVIDGTRKLSDITGTVERIGSIIVSGSTTFFIQVKGMNHLFTVPVTASAKVPVTKVGDTVQVQYYDSGESVMPVNKFDNLSFELTSSAIENDVNKRATIAIDESLYKANKKADIKAALEKLSPEERALIQKEFSQ